MESPKVTFAPYKIWGKENREVKDNEYIKTKYIW